MCGILICTVYYILYVYYIIYNYYIYKIIAYIIHINSKGWGKLQSAPK